MIERVPDHQLNFSITLYIQCQYATVLTLFPAHCHYQLPIENQFFIKYYWKMIFPGSKPKFFTLWRMIRDGMLSIDHAIARLPQKDMTFAEMKAKKVRDGGLPEEQ
jgi:hypothetical protein